MMKAKHTGNIPSADHLAHLLGGEHFRFAHLAIEGIDNEPVFAINAPGQREEEICLFHESVSTGSAYLTSLADRIETAIRDHAPLPVVRFADGEYAFYSGSLKCNGLYKQAESVGAIKAAFPAHAEAMRYLVSKGIMAPLIFPGNTRERKGLRALFGKKDGKDFAIRFLRFLERNQI
ncbi:MAG: hypothetical protein KJ899_09900, partial [Gammaproteobacteria bacterium]|nr:hypothetical protein [Gammaproteobacteria bacterium]